MNDQQLFDSAYSRTEPAYGNRPSSPLAAFLKQTGHHGIAFDLGAGAGRDSMAMAAAGYCVHCFDLSATGLSRIEQQADESGYAKNIKTHQTDVRDIEFPLQGIDLIVATTVLDHLPESDAQEVCGRMLAGLNHQGVMYVEVHTVDDPGCTECPQNFQDAPVSETADAVETYFQPNQLANWALRKDTGLRILHYEERLEWDTTHGPEHLHGKAILLAERLNAHRLWRGENPVSKRALLRKSQGEPTIPREDEL